MTANLIALAKDETGSELVETALCICMWTMCVIGIVYASFAMYAAHFVSNVAEDAARYAIVRGSTWNGASCSSTSTLDCTATSSDVSNYVTGVLPSGLSSNNLSVSTTWPGKNVYGNSCDTEYGSNSPNCVVKVKVTYNFNFPVPIINVPAISLTGNSEMTITS